MEKLDSVSFVGGPVPHWIAGHARSPSMIEPNRVVEASRLVCWANAPSLPELENAMKRSISSCAILSTLTLLGACDDGGGSATDPVGVTDVDPTPTGTSTVGAMDTDSDLFGGGMAPELEVEEPTPTEPEPDTAESPDSDPIVACASAVAVGENPVIDDFDDLDLVPLVTDNREGSWYSYTDGTPDAELMLSAVSGNSPDGEDGVLEVIGDAVDQYSGIGMGLRWSETGAERCWYDASLYDGLTFWARGRGSVRVALQNPSVRPQELGGQCPPESTCFDSHGTDIVLTEEWVQYEVAFDAITQAGWGSPVGAFVPAELFLIEFQFTPGVDYEMWLDDLTFYGEGVDSASPDGGGIVPESDASSPPPEDADGGLSTLDGGTPRVDGGTPPLDAGLSDAGL